jgi:hypothetical protein
MNYQMSLDPADKPLAIKDKTVVEDKGEGEDEDEELNSESAGRSGSVALSGSVGHPESPDLLSSTSQPVSDKNYISYDQAFVTYACTFTVGILGAECRNSSHSAG